MRWYGIISALRRGGATVIAVQVSPVNSNEVRGEELLVQIDDRDYQAAFQAAEAQSLVAQAQLQSCTTG